MSGEPRIEDRLISDLPGLTGFQINPLVGNNIRTVGDFEKLTKAELICLWGVGAITIKKVRAAIDLERNKRESAMPSQISDLTERKKSIADVIDLIRSNRVTWPSGQIDMPTEELVEMIQALSEPST